MHACLQLCGGGDAYWGVWLHGGREQRDAGSGGGQDPAGGRAGGLSRLVEEPWTLGPEGLLDDVGVEDNDRT
jgi:hypothetical protein